MPGDDNTEVDVDELFGKLSLEKDDVNTLTTTLQSDANLIKQIDKRGQSLLHLACLKNATKSIVVLIKAGADVNQENRDGERPIVLAFGNNNVDIIQHLINGGANLALDGPQLLLLAAKSNQPNLIQILLSNKIDVNFRDAANDDGKTALHIAAESAAVESVKLLIEKGANVNSCDNNNNTPLHLVCNATTTSSTVNIKNQEAIISLLLLSKSTNINAVNSDFRTPIYLATLNNQLPIVTLLLSKSARIDVCDCYNKNILHIALNNSFIEIALHLINHTTININAVDDDGDRPLDIACMNQLVDIVSLLLLKGANPNAIDNNTNTTAVTSTLTTTATTTMSKSVLLKVCEVGNLKILQLLLQAGANPNYIDASGNSPLHELFTKKHIDCIRCFVLYRHDETAANKTRNISPMKSSSSSSSSIGNNNTTTMNKINMNIDLNIKDGNERTILSKLCKWDNLSAIQLLFELSDALQLQLQRQANNLNSFLKLNTEIPDVYGNTPLHYIAEMHNENRVEIAKLLFQYGANVNAMNYYGDTVLIKACEQSDIEIATMLVESGADINFQGNEGHTALHKACLKHAGDVIELLIRYGADTSTLKDKEGRNAVDCCGENEAMKSYIESLLQAYAAVTPPAP